jgi:3-oxoacyl-[acyl-carrier-protein] synthase-1
LNPLLISAFTATTCVGHGRDALLHALRAGDSGLLPCRFETVDVDTCVGEVPGIDLYPLPAPLAEYECRNHRLAVLALAQDGFGEAVAACLRRHRPDRVGVFVGSSTSGILETELAYRARDRQTGALPASYRYATTQNLYSAAAVVRRALGLEGPAAVVSTACSSSAKVFGSAARLIAAGAIDAAVVGGVDSLCLTTLYGFSSLQLTSARPCRPFDVERDGISIGEGAAFFLVERAPPAPAGGALLLLGVGESSDAYHMSSPRPDGSGARLAMTAALHSADLAAADIDYINLHGTGTLNNDAAEGRAVLDLFGATTICSSSKGTVGHTLGAAGAVEAAICLLALQHGLAPGGVHTRQIDPAIPVNYLQANVVRPLSRVLSNSFGFGGTNCSLVFGTDRD